MRDRPLMMIIVLTATTVIIGGILAIAYNFAEPKIEAHRIAEERRAIFAVLPEAKEYETIIKPIQVDKGVEEIKIFKGLDEDGVPVGYAFVAKGPGFQGMITMMVGLNNDYVRLKGMQVLEQVETPGLGNKISGTPFLMQFKGLEILPKVEYIKNRKPEKPNQIQAITGATISSKAVVRIINKKIKQVTEALKSDQQE